jgi:hypothetical protein
MNKSDWVKIGDYELVGNSNTEITVSPIENKPIGIDAILLVPEKQ